MKWSADQAIRAARAFQPYDLTWLEEPVIPDDVAGPRARRRRGRRADRGRREPAHACGSSSSSSPPAASPIPEPDVTNCGGVTAFMKIARLAEAFNLPVTSHGAHDVTVQLLAACPNRSYLEAHGFGLERYIAEPLRSGGRLRRGAGPAGPRHRVRLAGPATADPRSDRAFRLHRRRRRRLGLRGGGAAGRRPAPRAPAGGRPFPPPSAPRHAARHLQDDQRQQVHALPPDGAAGASRAAACTISRKANVLGGGSSVNAQVYMRGRPCRLRRVARAAARRQRLPGLGAGPTCCRISRHGGQQPAARRAARRRTARCWSPIRATSTISRAGSCRPSRRWASRSTTDFNGPTQRGVGFYQFMNRQRQAQQRRLRLHRPARRAIPT